MKKYDLILLFQRSYGIVWRVIVGLFATIGIIDFYFTVIY